MLTVQHKLGENETDPLTGASDFSFVGRKVEHILPVGFCLLLRWISWETALVLALVSIFYGLFISKRVLPRTFDNGERARGFSRGKLYYGLCIFCLLLIFSDSFYIVAGAWGCLAFGDGLAGLVGQKYGRSKLPYNRQKSWLGSATFFFAASLASCLLMLWVAGGQGPELVFADAVLLGLAAGASGALVESLPLPINDNISSSIIPAAAIYSMSIWLGV
jgi:dolichol kinase